MSESLKVWSKFSVTNKAGTSLKLRIVEMPDNLYEVVIKMYMKYFVEEETFFKAAGVPKSAEAVEEKRRLLEVKEKACNIVICCFDDDDDIIHNNSIIGASLMTFTTKEEPDLKLNFQTKAMKKLFEIFYGMMSMYDEVKELHLDRYFSDRGIFVHTNYRGLGIAQELLKARRMVCKEHGVPINGAWMTSYGTQKAAERDGWETVYEISFEELGKRFGVTFETEPPSCKFMIARISC